MKITINHNGFHGHTTRAIIVDGKPGQRAELTQSQIKKLARAACGMSDCNCGESLLKAFELKEPWMSDSPTFFTIPDCGAEMEVKGNYPQILF